MGTKNKWPLTSAQLLNPELREKFQEARSQKVSTIDFAKEFLENFVSAQTKRAYIKDLEFFFEFLRRGGEHPTHPRDIQAYHFQLYRDHLRDLGLTSATINRRLVCIRSFLKWALATGLIEKNPLDAVKLPKVQTESPTPAFDDGEVVELLNAPDLTTKEGLVHKMALVFLFYLGLRRSELCQLKLQDIQKERGHIVLLIRGKGEKIRRLPLNDFLVDEIDSYLTALESTPVGELGPEDYLIQTAKTGKNDRPTDGSTIYRIVQKYIRQLGLNKKAGPHACRATAISHLLDTGKVPIRDVAQFAGHANVTTTERYDKKRKGLDDSAAYQVDYFGRPK